MILLEIASATGQAGVFEVIYFSYLIFSVGFLPNATAHTAHHILVYGCSIPGYHQRDTPRAIWDCGEMTGMTQLSRLISFLSSVTANYYFIIVINNKVFYL